MLTTLSESREERLSFDSTTAPNALQHRPVTALLVLSSSVCNMHDDRRSSPKGPYPALIQNCVVTHFFCEPSQFLYNPTNAFDYDFGGALYVCSFSLVDLC